MDSGVLSRLKDIATRNDAIVGLTFEFLGGHDGLTMLVVTDGGDCGARILLPAEIAFQLAAGLLLTLSQGLGPRIENDAELLSALRLGDIMPHMTVPVRGATVTQDGADSVLEIDLGPAALRFELPTSGLRIR